jgi:CheY-like chemotaxis protein/HPt (histidine-containing phosphotransfer) domain-containing protein
MLSSGDGQATIEWAVTDTGMGIAPNQIGSLFNEFVQADSSINRRFGGSGLGLSICKRLVERMGGEINVTSTLGEGSQFSFYLTLPTAENVALPELGDKAVYASFKSKLEALQRPLRILIVDDNETNRLVASKMLREFEIESSVACDGVEAVNTAKASSFDLILMDVQMPNMNGMQATQAIRACGGNLTTLPIIAMTANAFADDVQACRDAGMNDFVAKPVRKRLLIEAILRSLSNVSWQPKAVAAAAEVTIAAPPPSVPSPALAPSDGQLDLIAFKTLVEEIGDETAFELFAVFVKETHVRLPKFRKLLSDGGRLTIEREAHSLKSTAATFGFTEVARLAREVERSAGEFSADELSNRFDQLDAAFRAAEEQFAAQVVAD